jgi:hypothetical protein
MLEITNGLRAGHGLCGPTRRATASLAHLTQLQLATASDVALPQAPRQNSHNR